MKAIKQVDANSNVVPFIRMLRFTDPAVAPSVNQQGPVTATVAKE
jgi:hypothetical protein